MIQVSDQECLRDDACRYANKASQAGCEVELQVWSGLMHVWQLFEPELEEARQAFMEIERFLNEHP